MRVVAPESATPAPNGSVVTIGVYDGVHLGHRAVFEHMREVAGPGVEVTVVTFDCHPLSVLRPERAPRLLTGIDVKLELLASCGVDTTCVVTFDNQRAQEEPEQFVTDLLVERLAATTIVVGEDFKFGRNRRGDVELLRKMGSDLGFSVTAVELAESGSEPISSTRIRQCIADGEVEAAELLLGRAFSVRGVVEHGDGRGGPELGFPTANLALEDGLAQPGSGIYAGVVTHPSGASSVSAISVGRRPTFYDHADPLIECYLVDFAGDLYGQRLDVTFHHKLRDEARFDTVDALIAQMHLDVAQARSLMETSS